MASTVSTNVGNMVVVTHVLPANAAAGNTQQQNLVGVQRFIKGRPQALGTVQIIIGLMIFLFGIAMTPGADSLGIYSGIFVWGAGFYIAAGSLTVAAARRLTRCLVNCALAFSVIAAITATIGTILHFLDSAGLLIFCRYYCAQYTIRMQGVSGVLGVFNLLQLIVSATVARYACNATRNDYGQLSRPVTNQNQKLMRTYKWTPSVIVVPAQSLVTGQPTAPNTDEMQTFKGEASSMFPPQPPAYSAVVD